MRNVPLRRSLAGTFLVALAVLVSPVARAEPPAGKATAVFAGGCFWCMEKPFDELDGVLSTTSGYTGGTVVNPSYKDVSSGTTGHIEAVEIAYDPSRIRYEDLLEVFWKNIDPVDAGGQFCDRGYQYSSAIFVADESQRKAAEESLKQLAKSGRVEGKIATRIIDAAPFYRAEEYHQDYYRKNPIRYRYYRYGCGRDRRLDEVWGTERNGKAAPGE